MSVKEFQNAKNLVLSIHLIGETPEQETRLFEKNILSKDEFPLDLNVTLKVQTYLSLYHLRNILLIYFGLFYCSSLFKSLSKKCAWSFKIEDIVEWVFWCFLWNTYLYYNPNHSNRSEWTSRWRANSTIYCLNALHIGTKHQPGESHIRKWSSKYHVRGRIHSFSSRFLHNRETIMNKVT